MRFRTMAFADDQFSGDWDWDIRSVVLAPVVRPIIAIMWQDISFLPTPGRVAKLQIPPTSQATRSCSPKRGLGNTFAYSDGTAICRRFTNTVLHSGCLAPAAMPEGALR